MTDHEHAWRIVAHTDCCHWWATTAACECGAVLQQNAERDLADDPYSAVWMEDFGQAGCDRCRELMAGAAPEGVHNEVVPA